MPQRNHIHIDKALNNISVAYVQDANNFIADKVFPIVPVQKQSDRYFVYLKEDWFRDEAQERAPATESAGGDYDIDNTPSYFCKKYAYHKDITEEERTNADTPLNSDADATEFVTHKLLLKREVLWANKFFKPGVWSTDLVGKPSSPGVGEFLQWDNKDSDPIKLITDAGASMAGKTGYKPNVLVLGPHVYNALKNHPAILERIKYTEKGIMTAELLASLFEVEKVLTAWAIKNSAPKGAAENTNFIFGKHALLAYAAPKPSLKKPSAGYIFAWTGLLGAGAYGNRILRIPMPHLGLGTERIEGEMAFDMKVVASDLGIFFSNAVS